MGTFEVLIFNPNGPNISVQSVRGSVTQQQQRQVDLVDYGPQAPTNTSKSSTAQTGVSRTHGVGVGVVTLCSVHAVYLVYVWAGRS